MILCGGAFNTPQLLMLSGIGPAAHLREHGIDARVDLPGVGSNLQDRYEVALTHRMRRPWRVLDGASFARGDALWQRWNASRAGMYASNGAALALIGRSAPERPEPDLFFMALLARFEGYRPGFSKLIGGPGEFLTWAILKAHTENRAGTVRLRSADPLDPPLVNFHYFDEGSDARRRRSRGRGRGRPLRAPPDRAADRKRPDRRGARARRRGRERRRRSPTTCATPPGATTPRARARSAPTATRAPCSTAPSASAARSGLRVVDASVFPRIPGFFIASAVYIAAEKAADAILHDARAATRERAPAPSS